MTDLLCESAKLDDWMKEVPSAGTPETFSDDSPAFEEAGEHRIAVWAQMSSCDATARGHACLCAVGRPATCHFLVLCYHAATRMTLRAIHLPLCKCCSSKLSLSAS